DLSKIEAGSTDIRLEQVNVNECLQKSAAILQNKAQEAKVSFTLATRAGDPVLVTADPMRLMQIFINLGSNAIKYNHPGGRADISVAPDASGDVAVRFTDTGAGIPASFHDQVFQPFNRLTQTRSVVD